MMTKRWILGWALALFTLSGAAMADDHGPDTARVRRVAQHGESAERQHVQIGGTLFVGKGGSRIFVPQQGNVDAVIAHSSSARVLYIEPSGAATWGEMREFFARDSWIVDRTGRPDPKFSRASLVSSATQQRAVLTTHGSDGPRYTLIERDRHGDMRAQAAKSRPIAGALKDLDARDLVVDGHVFENASASETYFFPFPPVTDHSGARPPGLRIPHNRAPAQRVRWDEASIPGSVRARPGQLRRAKDDHHGLQGNLRVGTLNDTRMVAGRYVPPVVPRR